MEDLDKPAEDSNQDETEISEAIRQMDSLYKSRCVKAPLGSNIVIREIPNDDQP